MKSNISDQIYSEVEENIRSYCKQLQTKDPDEVKKYVITSIVLFILTFIVEAIVMSWFKTNNIAILLLVGLCLYCLYRAFAIKKIEKTYEYKSLRDKQIDEHNDIAEMILGDASKACGLDDNTKSTLALYLLQNRKLPFYCQLSSVIVNVIFIAFVVWTVPGYKASTDHWWKFAGLVVINLFVAFIVNWLVAYSNTIYTDSFDYHIIKPFEKQFNNMEEEFKKNQNKKKNEEKVS